MLNLLRHLMVALGELLAPRARLAAENLLLRQQLAILRRTTRRPRIKPWERRFLCIRSDPQSGTLFVFVGKSKTRVKVLWFERNGYSLLYKRLHRALFFVPRASGGTTSLRIDAGGLATLLSGVPRQRVRKKLDA